MTTPYQSAPDGAIVVGGGTWNYGQTMNEDIGRAAFEFPMPTFDNMLDLLRLALERLPIDALQPWADFLGIVDGVFTSAGQAVDAIIDALIDHVGYTLQEFTDWLNETFQPVKDWLDSLQPLLDWLFATITNALQPAFEAALGFFDWVGASIGVPSMQYILDFFNAITSNLGNLDIINSVATFFSDIVNALGAGMWDVLSDILSFFQNFISMFGNLNILEEVSNFFTGVIDTAGSIANWAADILGLDFLYEWVKNTFFDPIIRALTGAFDLPDLGALATWARDLLSANSPLNPLNLIGQIPAMLLGQVPVSSIGFEPVNLLSQGSFGSADGVIEADGWSFDPDKTHSTGSTGSAQAACNGVTKTLYSTQSIPVAEDQVIEAGCYVSTSGFVGTGLPIKLVLIPFVGAQPQSEVVVAERAGSTSWVFMDGASYTVPGNITSIRVALRVTSDATAGSVWFDDVSLQKTGKMGQSLVDSLIDAWEGIWDGVFGSGGAGKQWFDIQPAIASVSSTANTASSTASSAAASAAVADSKADQAKTALVKLGSNMVSNPGFEDTTLPIVYGGGVYSTEQKRSGTYSVKQTHTSSGGHSCWLFTGITSVAVHKPALPGDTFYCEIWYYGHASNIGTDTVGLYAASYAADGTIINNNWVTGGFTSTPTKGAWTKLSGYVTMPANTVTFNVSVHTTGAATNNIYYYDSAVVREVTSGYNAQSTANTASTNANTSLANWASAHDRFGLGSVSAWLDDLFGTKGTANSALADAVAAQLAADAAEANAQTGITNAATADGKAVSINQALFGQSTPGSAIAQSKVTNLATDLAAKLTSSSSLNASNLLSGWLSAARVSDNSLPQAKVTSLPSDLSTISTNATNAGNTAGTALTDAAAAQVTADDATATGLANAADIVALKAAQSGGNNSGYSGSDTFDYINAATLNTANWAVTLYGSYGHLGVNGSDAYWVNGSVSPSGYGSEVARWNAGTATDYQVVTMVVNTAGAGSNGVLGLIARANSALTEGVRVSVSPVLGVILLEKLAGGAIGSTYFHGGPIPNGATIQLIAGTSSNVRGFQVKMNGATVIDAVDNSGTLSLYGAGYRYSALEYKVYSTGSVIENAGKVAAWSVADNAPAPVVGSGYRVYKSSGTHTITANGDNLFPNSFFNGFDYGTSDYTYDAATANKLTVAYTGWYHVQINVGLTINTMITDMAAVLYRNGTMVQRGPSFWGITNGVIGTRGPAHVGGSFIIYLEAGDYIQPGYWQTTLYSASGTLTAGSSTTYFAASLINKSTA